MAEGVLLHGKSISIKLKVSETDIWKRPLHIVKCIRYYSHVCVDKGVGFVSKVATHDIAILVLAAVKLKLSCTDDLLESLLTLSNRNNIDMVTLQGIRQAQINLATELLLMDENGFARKIFIK